MHSKIIFDTSAVMALLNKEDGYEVVMKHLDRSIISSVNFSEVIAVANGGIFKNEEVQKEGVKLLNNTFLNIIDFDYEQAIIAGEFDKITKKIGLSLGDRACLALGKCRNLPVLTSDRVWKKLKIGVDVRLIR